jgi:O-antigen ligase
MEVTRYISLVALFLILFHFISDLDKLKNAVWVIITISILTAIYSYYLVFDMGIKTFLLSGISAFHSLHGGLGNANSLAFLIGISIPIIFSHLLYSRQKNKLFSVILLIFLFIIWLLCNSRSSYVYLLVSVIFIFFFHRKRRLYLGISIIIASIIFVLIFISPVIQQLVRLESGLSHRDELWKGAFRMFTNSPFIGMGPLSFNDFKFYYVDAGIAREICAYQFGGAAHNLYLTKAAELGIFSVIIIFALWGYITWYFFANRKHIQKQPLNYLYIACGAIFTGLMFRSIFEIGGLIGNGRLGENLLPLLIVAMIIRIPMLYKNGEK